ncbi:hypothetical protein [Streptomyces sp. NPDC085932]|uniref:hypothetical protein n=1 Tax=Streptomyces sp. NPDC085932 TaxID=3365741 RepID=UPI0037D54490
MDTLFRDDAALSDSVGWVLDLHYRALEQERAQQEESRADEGAARRLLDAVLALLGDGLLPDRFQIQGVSSDGLWVRMPGRKAPFPLRELSDGYRSVAALVLDIVRQIHAAYECRPPGRCLSCTSTAPSAAIWATGPTRDALPSG